VAERACNLGLTELSAGGDDQRFDRAFAAIGNRYLAHLGARENRLDAALHRLSDRQSRNAAFIRIGRDDDTQDSPPQRGLAIHADQANVYSMIVGGRLVHCKKVLPEKL